MNTHLIQYKELLRDGYVAHKSFRTTDDAVKQHMNKLSANNKVFNIHVSKI
jgi:hypothetical protein